MPLGPLEVQCHRTLQEIQNVSRRIRSSALQCVDHQNFHVFETLDRQLQSINTSCDTISATITRASFTDYALDDRIVNWIFRGGPHQCLEKLREVDNFLTNPSIRSLPARVPSRPLTQHGDNLAAAISLLDEHRLYFHLLVTCDVWDRERLEERRQDRQETRMSTTSTVTGHSRGSSGQAPAENTRITSQQRLDEVSRWLDAWDCSQRHTDTLKLRQDKTCKWFPNTGAYKVWRTRGFRFLWLRGKAGCGKSVLAASTINYIESKLDEGEVIVFHYCDFRNERSTSATEVMRSLLSQMFRHFHDLGIDAGHLPNTILEEKSEGTLSLNDVEKLSHLVLRAASCFPQEPIIVIDGLDECADIEALLRALVPLTEATANVRLLVTSRPHDTISHHFDRFPSMSFESVAKELAVDIELYITQELDSRLRLGIADRRLKNEMRMKLTEKAEGRFRWVQCQLDTLMRCSNREELRETLEDLPGELETTYERILWKIDERKSEGKLVQCALAWLVVALEPLRLTQIVEGLSFYPRQEHDHEARPLGNLLLDALSSLISYSEETGIISLSHFSVKEYLASPFALPMYQIIPRDAHANVIKMCMTYVSVFLKRARAPSGIKVRSLESSPILSYVFSSGFNHLALVDPSSVAVLEALDTLGSDIRHHPTHWDRLCELREDSRTSYLMWPSSRHDVILYILIAYSSVELLQSFLSRRHVLRPRIGTNPLVYAADLRKTKHAMALLACGADVNVPSLVVDDSYKALPLEIAVDRGDTVLVGDLLNRGSVVSSELLSTAVCMPWCSTGVLVKLVQTDEFTRWAKNIGDKKLCRGIFSSARPNAGDRNQADADQVALARRLHDVGHDLSADIPFTEELIRRALSAAHTSMLEFLLPLGQQPYHRYLNAAATGDTPETVSVLRFLLSRGIDVHGIWGRRKDTALHLAAMCPWEPRSLELVKLLVDAGYDPHARNSRGQTPLTIAIQRRYTSVVGHMISRAPPNILVLAQQRRYTHRVIAYLIHNGANVHYTTSSGDTLAHLIVAASGYKESECLKLLKSFAKAGCSLTSSNSEGRTVLDTAAGRGYNSVVEWLLQHNISLSPTILLTSLQGQLPFPTVVCLVRAGADVHCTTLSRDTVGHLAITKYEELECLELLKSFAEAGCSLASSNSEGRTILDTAAGHGYTLVVEWLLQHNISLSPTILLTSLQGQLPFSTIVHLACAGADAHCTTPSGDTVAHLAITKYKESMCLELLKYFVEAGCGLASSNSEGRTVLDTAAGYGYALVVKWLLQRNVPFSPTILLASLQGQPLPISAIMHLVRAGAYVHCTTPGGDTVAHLAITKYKELECLELLKYFVEAGCSLISSNSGGRTLLDTAAGCRHTLIVKWLLLQHNISLSPTILLTLLQEQLPIPAITHLVRAGADVHCTTSTGDTVAHLAITKYKESMCLELLKYFVEVGCSLTSSNSRGRTVLDTAAVFGYALVVEWLLQHNVPLSPTILLTSLQGRLSPSTVVRITRAGVDVHCTTLSGDTVGHLAIIKYEESECLELLKSFVEAGYNSLTSSNHEGSTVLGAAIGRGYPLVVEWLAQLIGEIPGHNYR